MPQRPSLSFPDTPRLRSRVLVPSPVVYTRHDLHDDTSVTEGVPEGGVTVEVLNTSGVGQGSSGTTLPCSPSRGPGRVPVSLSHWDHDPSHRDCKCGSLRTSSRVRLSGNPRGQGGDRSGVLPTDSIVPVALTTSPHAVGVLLTRGQARYPCRSTVLPQVDSSPLAVGSQHTCRPRPVHQERTSHDYFNAIVASQVLVHMGGGGGVGQSPDPDVPVPIPSRPRRPTAWLPVYLVPGPESSRVPQDPPGLQIRLRSLGPSSKIFSFDWSVSDHGPSSVMQGITARHRTTRVTLVPRHPPLPPPWVRYPSRPRCRSGPSGARRVSLKR